MKQQKFGTELGLDVKDPLCELCEDVPSDLSVMIVVVKSPKFSPAGCQSVKENSDFWRAGMDVTLTRISIVDAPSSVYPKSWISECAGQNFG